MHAIAARIRPGGEELQPCCASPRARDGPRARCRCRRACSDLHFVLNVAKTHPSVGSTSILLNGTSGPALLLWAEAKARPRGVICNNGHKVCLFAFFHLPSTIVGCPNLLFACVITT